jgi:hypothetical protein
MHDEPETGIELGEGERRVADRLVSDRPVPGAGFRGTLGRYLAARDPGYGPRPEQLVVMVLAYVACGLLLIGVGALIATGAI